MLESPSGRTSAPRIGEDTGRGAGAKDVQTLALVGLVLSGLGVITMLFVVGLFFAVPGVVCSLIALRRTREPSCPRDRKFALAGLIAGYCAIAVSVLVLILLCAYARYSRVRTGPHAVAGEQIDTLRKAGPQAAYQGVLAMLSAGRQAEAEEARRSMPALLQEAEQRIAREQASPAGLR
jgi:hypothetical protein